MKTYSSAVDECRVITESPGEVDIYIMVDGKLPTESFIKELTEKLKNGEQRPLTDHVVVKAPETVKYEIDLRTIFGLRIGICGYDPEGSEECL